MNAKRALGAAGAMSNAGTDGRTVARHGDSNPAFACFSELALVSPLSIFILMMGRPLAIDVEPGVQIEAAGRQLHVQ